MISKAKVIQENPEYKTLINAVISNLGGTHYVNDVNSHGIGGGFPGFTYYSDTHKFAMRYRKLIVKLLEDMADQLGEDVLSMVSGFNCLNMDDEDKRDFYRYIGFGRVKEQCSVTNAMAWFAAEEVCRMFDR